LYDGPVATVLLVSDLAPLRTELRTMLEAPGIEIEELASGPDAIARVRHGGIDLVLTDLQIGAMGGVALALEMRNDESIGLADPVSIILLLDRRADVFLATRVNVEGFLVKPLDALRVRRAVRAVLAGEGFEDDALRPATVTVSR
jgi:DNA-binding NarL/FixJ family response regulator